MFHLRRFALFFALVFGCYGQTGGLNIVNGVIDFSGAGATGVVKVVANVGALPGTCSVGYVAYVTAAAAGSQLYLCGPANTWTQVVSGGSGGSGTVSAGTVNQVAKYAASGSTVSGSAILSDDATNAYVDGPLDIKTNSLVVEVANSGSPGTTVNKLVKIPAGVASVLTTSAADVISAIGVVVGGAGTTGSAQIGVLGRFPCLFDNTATAAGDFITPSSVTAATCHDAGAAYPSTGEVMGQVLSTNGACGSPPCGPYTVLFGTPDVFLPGSGGSNGNNGNGNSGGAKQQLHSVNFNISGGGSTITTGDILTYPGSGASTGTINRVDISGYGTAGAACSITVDIWKRNAAIPTSGQKISASAPATLSSANLSQSGSLSGWTTAVAANDVWGASVASVTGCISALVQVWFQ